MFIHKKCSNIISIPSDYTDPVVDETRYGEGVRKISLQKFELLCITAEEKKNIKRREKKKLL